MLHFKAQEELTAEDPGSGESTEVKKAAFKQLSSTLEALMKKLDKTEQGIELQ